MKKKVKKDEVTFTDKVNRSIKVLAKSSGLSITVVTDKIINPIYEEFIRIIGDGDTSDHILHPALREGGSSKVFFIFECLYPKEFITRLRPSRSFLLNLMTLDVETYVDSN